MLAAALAAPPPARACLTSEDAEAVVLVGLPDIIHEAGVICSARLPDTSILRQTSGPFLAKYQAAADQAWPSARAAIVKVTDPAAGLLLDSSYARPLLTSLLIPLVVGRLNPQDCGTLDRLVTGLAPLPPRNTASLVVTALSYAKDEKARGKNVAVPNLPLCAGAPQ